MKLFKNYNRLSEEDLMALLTKGDHQAFSHLYDRYAGKLTAYFFRMLWSDKAMAEDKVHDLFSKIIEKPGLYKSGMPVKPWIYQMASNMCKNTYRHKTVEMNFLKYSMTEESRESGIEDKMDFDINMAHLARCLEQLDTQKRSLFLMRYQQDISIGELATIHNVPEGTIKSRLFNIKKFISGKFLDNSKLQRYGK